jgi:hypothetical protein
MTKNLKKRQLKKIIFFYQKLQFTYPLDLHSGRPSYKRSLQLSKEVGIFALLDPEPDPDLDSEYGSGSTSLIISSKDKSLSY